MRHFTRNPPCEFGASSERIERVLEQLELALEEAETAKAEAIAAQPQPVSEAANTEPQPAEDAKPEKKKRRQLPPEFPRRDVVHAPPGVCKTCGGSELRKVGERVTEVLRYVPGHFEVDRHVRPACSCRKCVRQGVRPAKHRRNGTQSGHRCK